MKRSAPCRIIFSLHFQDLVLSVVLKYLEPQYLTVVDAYLLLIHHVHTIQNGVKRRRSASSVRLMIWLLDNAKLARTAFHSVQMVTVLTHLSQRQISCHV